MNLSEKTSNENSFSEESLINSENEENNKEYLKKIFIHPFLSFNDINNERKKILLCNELKRKYISNKYHTDNSKIFDLFNKDNKQINYIKDNLNSKKNFKCFSLKLKNTICVKNSINFYYKNKIYNFNLYNDKDIGFDKNYNKLIINSNLDDDNDSEEEEIIEEGIKKEINIVKKTIAYKQPFLFTTYDVKYKKDIRKSLKSNNKNKIK